MAEINVIDLLEFLSTEVDIKTVREEKETEQKPNICPSCKKEYIPDENVDLQNKCPLCGIALDGEGQKTEELGDKDLGVPTVEAKLKVGWYATNEEDKNVAGHFSKETDARKKVKELGGEEKGIILTYFLVCDPYDNWPF